jgi:hypothetical protein
MMKHSILIIALGAGLAIAPTVSVATAAPPQRERAAAQYHFRAADQAKLREHYQGNFRENDHIDVAHRAGFRVGARLNGDWRARIHAVPEAIVGELPAIPAGLAIGYLDGYAIVYDPNTGEIVETLDVY